MRLGCLFVLLRPALEHCHSPHPVCMYYKPTEAKQLCCSKLNRCTHLETLIRCCMGLVFKPSYNAICPPARAHVPTGQDKRHRGPPLAPYSQCGGMAGNCVKGSWQMPCLDKKYPTPCHDGFTCNPWNQWYYQCIPIVPGALLLVKGCPLQGPLGQGNYWMRHHPACLHHIMETCRGHEHALR